ncbi:MAG: hypothetical protein M3Y64_03215 [Gemmatimonadota bacterium]|nr:hypothetical protein [Gemmatimonadota bacterium]
MSALTGSWKSVAVVITISALFTATWSAAMLQAQQPVRTPAAQKRAADDSTAKAVADSADDDDSGQTHGTRSTITGTPFARSYSIGRQAVSEQSVGIAWRLTSPRVGAESVQSRQN